MKFRCSIIFSILVAVILCSKPTPVMAAGIGNLTDDNLVVNWKFDEEDGDSVHDEKGNHEGVVYGASTIEGYSGKAKSFDGDDYIKFNDKIIPTGKKSIRFKIRLKSNQPMGYVLTNITGNYGGDGYNDYGLSIQAYDSKIAVNIYQNHKSVAGVASTSLSSNEWHDVLFTWDGSTDTNKFQIYVDNMVTPNSMSTSQSKELKEPSLNLLIGRRHPDASPYMLNGDIDEIEVYNEFYKPITAPSNLNAEPYTNKILLSWDSVERASSYVIKRSTSEGGPYTTIATNISETEYYDTDVTIGTTYYYVVCAVEDGMVSLNSDEASATIEEVVNEKALLVIYMHDELVREYEMSKGEIEDFISWYNESVENEKGGYYMIKKKYNLASFNTRKDYIIFKKIICFEVMEYDD